MKKSIIIIVIYLCLSLIIGIYHSNKKYIILNNDYMFEVGNSINPIKKYPSYLNNSKINYYDLTVRKNGYLSLINSDLSVNQIEGNNINIYTDDYKKINGKNIVVTKGLKDINVINIEKQVSKKMNKNDSNTINKFLDDNDLNNYSINYYRRYTFDINNDGKDDYLYIISNISLDSIYENYNLDSNSLSTLEDYSQYGFIKMGDNYIKVFEVNSDDSSGIKNYDLSNIFDINNDSIYELNFSKNDYYDYNYHCEIIYQFDNNKVNEYEICNVEDK